MRSEVVNESGSGLERDAQLPVVFLRQVGRASGELNIVAEAPESPELVPVSVLKDGSLSALAGLVEGALTRRQAVRVLLARGVKRNHLLRWATEAGYTRGYVPTLLNQILRELTGVRQRKPGAGPKKTGTRRWRCWRTRAVCTARWPLGFCWPPIPPAKPRRLPSQE